MSDGSAGLTSRVATEVVNWLTTHSVLPSPESAMPRGPLCTPTGLLVEQHTTGRPSTSAGQPVQFASVAQATPGLDVNAPHTCAPYVPTVGGMLSVGTETSVGSGSPMTASSAGMP